MTSSVTFVLFRRLFLRLGEDDELPARDESFTKSITVFILFIGGDEVGKTTSYCSGCGNNDVMSNRPHGQRQK